MCVKRQCQNHIPRKYGKRALNITTKSCCESEKVFTLMRGQPARIANAEERRKQMEDEICDFYYDLLNPHEIQQ